MSWQNIPEELKSLPQWVGAGEDKIPFDPKTGRKASVDQPDSWGTFDQACSCGLPYIGFVFTPQDPYTFIDLDTGKKPDLTKLHTEIILAANSYTETSKSGTSSHIVVKGTLPQGFRDDYRAIEVYPHGRYMLTTGWVYHGDGIQECQELLDYLASQIQKNRFTMVGDLESEPATRTDEELYYQICEAENAEKFLALFNGQWQHYDEYMQDHSRADLGLLTFLDFYTKDVEQVVRMFKYSKLYRPEKGRKGGDATDYIIRTLKSARARNEADYPPLADFSVLIERANDIVNQVHNPPVNPTPKNSQLSFPPGLVGEIANYVYVSSTRPVPEVALMGALAMVAGMCGRQFNISGSGLNLYLILLAPTGTGKEGAGSGISNLLSRVRETVPSVDQFVGPAEYASGPALIRTLDNQPCLFSILGEFGLRLQAMADLKANGAEKTLHKALLNIYSKSGWHQTENSSAYSDRDKNTKTLYAPALTIFGESTPETFFEGLSEKQVLSGLLPRFMFIEYQGTRPPRNKISAFCDPDPGLVGRVADLAATCIQMQANTACAPVMIDQEAQAVLDAFDTHCDEKINSNSEVYKHLWNRAHLKALRLSGVVAVGINAMQPIVTKDIATWAVDFVKKDVEVIESRFRNNEVGEGEHRFETEIRKAVEHYLLIGPEKRAKFKVPKAIINEPIIPYAYLRRRLRSLSGFKNDRRGVSWAIQAALKDLCEAGILQLVPPLTRKNQYGITSDIYVIGENW